MFAFLYGSQYSTEQFGKKIIQFVSTVIEI